MGQGVRKSLLISFGQTYAILLMQFGVSLVIARLLTPHELGVYSVAMVFVLVAQTIRDMGVVDYVVQEQTLTDNRIRAAILVTVVSAWCLAGLTYVLASPIADFYREPDIEALLYILGINFFILPFGSIVAAYHRRQLNFPLIAKIRLSVASVQAVLSVLLAWLGYRYFALAWASVAATLVGVALNQLVRPRGFPLLPRIGEIKRVMSFGAMSSSNALLMELIKALPDMVLGRLATMAAVGQFGRANGLIDLFNRMIGQAIMNIALPHLSARAREGQDVRADYLRSLTYLTGIGWPIYLYLGFTAIWLIPLLFGDQWQPAIPVAQVLALGELLLVPFYLQGTLFVAMGQIRKETVRCLLYLGVRFVPIVLLAQHGILMVAYGYVMSNLVMTVISYIMLRRGFGVSLRTLARTLWPSVVVSGIVLLALSAVFHLTYRPGDPALLPFFMITLTCILAWLTGVWVAGHPIRDECVRVASSLKMAAWPYSKR